MRELLVGESVGHNKLNCIGQAIKNQFDSTFETCLGGFSADLYPQPFWISHNQQILTFKKQTKKSHVLSPPQFQSCGEHESFFHTELIYDCVAPQWAKDSER